MTTRRKLLKFLGIGSAMAIAPFALTKEPEPIITGIDYGRDEGTAVYWLSYDGTMWHIVDREPARMWSTQPSNKVWLAA